MALGKGQAGLQESRLSGKRVLALLAGELLKLTCSRVIRDSSGRLKKGFQGNLKYIF